jgi:hypothetical protein
MLTADEVWRAGSCNGKLVTDNYFTSLTLFLELMARGFWTTKTMRNTRSGFLASLVGFPATVKLDQGDFVVRMH